MDNHYIPLVSCILASRIWNQSYHNDKNAHEIKSGRSVCRNLESPFHFACYTQSQTVVPFGGFVCKLVHSHSPHPSCGNVNSVEESAHELP